MSGDKLPPGLADAIEFALERLGDAALMGGWDRDYIEAVAKDSAGAETVLREAWDSFRAEHEQRERALAFVVRIADASTTLNPPVAASAFAAAIRRARNLLAEPITPKDPTDG